MSFRDVASSAPSRVIGADRNRLICPATDIRYLKGSDPFTLRLTSEAGAGDAEGGFCVLAQLEEEVSAFHAVLERLLHKAGEIGVVGLGEAGLGVGDRGVQGGGGVSDPRTAGAAVA